MESSTPPRDTAWAMSEENVELTHRVIEGWNQSGAEGVVGLLSPEWVGHPFAEWPSDPIYRGRRGFAKLGGEWTDTFDEVKWETEKLIDAGDAVVALVTHKGRIRGTGIPISQPVGAVFTSFADGMVGEMSFFMTWDGALEAAGLSE
jgi:ketosteroid isomerase-like protein